MLLHSFLSLVCMLSKRENHNFKKRRRGINLKMNLKMPHTQVSFIWIKEARNKLSMTKKNWRACWIRLVQLNHILQKTVFSIQYGYIVRHLKRCHFLIHTFIFDPRQYFMDLRHPHQTFNPRHPYHPRQNCTDPSYPCHPQTHATTPHTLFSRQTIYQKYMTVST